MNDLRPDAIDVVSWDVDGTLYDLGRATAWIGLSTVREMMRRGAAPVRLEHERLRRFREHVDQVRRRGGTLAAGDLPPDRDELVALEERWYGPAIGRAGLRPRVGRWIAGLTARGVRQVVVSDYRADYKLDRLGLAGRFERVYAGEVLGHVKPDPALFRAVVAELGVAPERVLHVGDKIDRDRAAAEGAGCRSWILGEDPSVLDRLAGG